MILLYLKWLKANINILRNSCRFTLFTQCEITKCYPVVPKFSKTLIVDNSMWGIQNVIDLSKNNNVLFEHGWFWGDTIIFYHNHQHIKKIITFVDYRKKFLQILYPDKIIVNVSEYMNDLLEMRNISTCNSMRKYRRYTLYFPDKSSSVEHYNHDLQHIENVIKEIKSLGFQEILVPIFYLDFDKRFCNQIRSLGGIPLCFGHRYDSQFLPRLMSVLSASKLVVVDRPGTNLLYAHWLQIPVLISKKEFLRGKVKETYLQNLDDNKINQINLMIKALPKLGKHYERSSLTKDEQKKIKYNFGWDAKSNRELVQNLEL